MGPVDLKIIYDQSEYYAGQVLSGHVLVKLETSVPVTLIKIRTLGEGQVKWTESRQHQQTSSNGTQTVTEYYTMYQQEKYLDVKTTLFQSESGQSFSSGVYRYPFTIDLPPNLPGSFDVGKKMAAMGQIVYICRATLKSTKNISLLSSKCKVTEAIMVHGFAPAPLGLVGIVSQEDNRKIPCCGACCCCITCGKIKGIISINKSHFLAGETVIIKAEIENRSKITLDSIRFSIIQRIDLHAGNGSRAHEENVEGFLDCDRGPLTPGNNVSLDNIRLTIPHLPSTIEGASRILFVKYFAAVIVGKGTGCLSPKVGFRIPITIGPTSLAQVVPQTGYAENPPSYTDSIITSQPTAFSQYNPLQYS